jgi:hypothetical protein
VAEEIEHSVHPGVTTAVAFQQKRKMKK